MKPAFALYAVLLSLLLSAVSAPGAAASAMETASFAGQTYVRLTDWARANGFDARWLQPGESISLTNRFMRMVFQKDSKNCEFRGVNVLLSYPLVVHGDVAYVADTDLRLTLGPLLSPPPPASTTHIRTIVIDPGHGGKDPGFQVGPNQEKKYTLLLAQELRDQLKKAGFNVFLTRTSDTYVEKSARPEIAKKHGADLFISLHWNAVTAGKNDVEGVQTYCLTPPGAQSSNESGDVSDTSVQPGNRNNDKSLFLAYTLQKSLVQNLGSEDRGVRRARFTVLCLAEMPAILIEGGYMSHPLESRRIYDPAYRRLMARAIVSGVMAYKRQVELPPPPPAPATNSSHAPSHPAVQGSTQHQ